MPRRCILVADDSEVFQAALCSLLHYLLDRIVIATAQDGEEALQLIKEINPDLLILDINMPTMDGWQVLSLLHNLSLSVPTIVLTAHANPALEKRALNAGADAWVPKGNIPLLIDTIQQLLAD